MSASGELNDEFLALGTGRRVRGGGAALTEVAVGEGGGIEFGCFASFPVVEPQARNHLLGHVALSSQVFKTHRKFGSRSPASEKRLHRA